jgi:hypothetical protein
MYRIPSFCVNNQYIKIYAGAHSELLHAFGQTRVPQIVNLLTIYGMHKRAVS